MYEGGYLRGRKEGRGRVSTVVDGVERGVIYEGEWKKGLPEGEGYRFDEEGTRLKTFYIEGINVFSLEDQSQ